MCAILNQRICGLSRNPPYPALLLFGGSLETLTLLLDAKLVEDPQSRDISVLEMVF